MFDWNDLRFLLAVSRSGSTLAAARELCVNQTTVARRIDALERALGLQLFERRPEGYRLTASGAKTLALAQRVETAAGALGEAAAAWRRDISGLVRVTTTELIAMGIVAPLISQLRLSHPRLQIELVADDRRLDLRSGEVDVALRLSEPEPLAGVVGRHIGDSNWGIFCSRGYCERHGVPRIREDLNRHSIVGGTGGLASLPALLWLAGLAPAASIAVRCNSVPNMIAAVRSGVGVGALPFFAVGGDRTFVRCLSPEFERSTPIWLLYRESLRNTPHVRVFLDAVIGAVAAARGRLTGREEATEAG